VIRKVGDKQDKNKQPQAWPFIG